MQDVAQSAVSNLFELRIEPIPSVLYRGRRDKDSGPFPPTVIASGPNVFSPVPFGPCKERVAAIPAILKDLVRRCLLNAISECNQFFDISSFALSGTVSGELLHKENVCSIARSFQLQVMFDEKGFYLAVLAGQKVYNRLRLPEVLSLLGSNAVSLPHRALCFAGKGSGARWRDGTILSISSESCIVRVPSVNPSELTLPNHRIIPKLNIATIKRLLRLKGSNTNIEKKMKQLRSSGGKSEGQYTFNSTQALLRDHLAPLFPLPLGESRVYISDEACSLNRLTTKSINKSFECKSIIDGRTHVFNSPLDGLKTINFAVSRSYPVATFCTRDTKAQLQELVANLNHPADSFGGFRGMEAHFGIRLDQLPDCPYVVDSVEDYVEAAKSLVLSPDPHKQSALALVSLSEEDETYSNPVPLYYRLKALLARTGHASQMVDRETLGNKFARWNVALNTAAKLGSIPWTLSDDSTLRPVDLFLGLSFSSIRTAKLGQSRNIAYVNVFDSAGTWRMFCADGDAFSFEERVKILPRIASEAVRSATDEPRALGTIEVHYNKRFGFRERQAIAKGIRDLAPNASIIFVSISDEHPIRFFDRNNDQYSCARGTVLQLSNDTAYVQTIGADKWSGLPRPLRIQLYRDFCGTTENVLNVSERILGLTRLNWRSVRNYSSLPVTILYSSLVARLTNYFGLSDWKEIDHDLKRTPWFL